MPVRPPLPFWSDSAAPYHGEGEDGALGHVWLVGAEEGGGSSPAQMCLLQNQPGQGVRAAAGVGQPEGGRPSQVHGEEGAVAAMTSQTESFPLGGLCSKSQWQLSTARLCVNTMNRKII